VRKRKEAQTCSQGICLQNPGKDGLCFYHAKVVAGLIDPALPAAYSKAIRERAYQREMARLRKALAS